MNVTNRHDFLLSDILKNQPLISSNRISQGTSIQPLSTLTFSEHDSHPSSKLPSVMTTTAPIPPLRDASSMKHHRRRQKIDKSDKQNKYQPLLNSSTLDDLFRALTLECEQYLADTSSYQNKTYGQMIVQPSSNVQAAVESNDDDYENLHTSRFSQPITNGFSPLKTSIEVISPIKRHVVSITVSSKISSPQLVSHTKTPCMTTKSILPPTNGHSSEDDPINISSSSSINRKRRRRARKQLISSIKTRSSSSSNERNEIITGKKPIISKRSYSTDPRHQRNKNSYDNNFISNSPSQKQLTRRPRRRDVSLQHSLPISGRFRENHPSPLSVLLTSTKATSDFLDNSHQQQQQQRRSRLESIKHKPSTLLDRMHQQFYRPSPAQNHNNNNNIPTHRIPSYPVY